MSIQITEENFETEVMQATMPILVDFWADWCGPCRMLGPVIEQLAQEHTEIKVCKLNVDEQTALAKQFNVASIPTVIAFKGGKEVGRSLGAVPKEKLLALL